MPAAAFLDDLDECFQCRNEGSDVGDVVSHCAHFSPWRNRPNLRKVVWQRWGNHWGSARADLGTEMFGSMPAGGQITPRKLIAQRATSRCLV